MYVGAEVKGQLSGFCSLPPCGILGIELSLSGLAANVLLIH